jgi:hypothetical protein
MMGMFFLGSLLGACAHTPGGNTPVTDIYSGAPDWVVRGSAALAAGKDRILYGVGASQGVQNLPLAIEDANLRARASLASIFSTYVSRLERDYARSLGAGRSLKDNDEAQGIETPLEGFTRMELKGSQVVNHWQDPKTGTIFALAAIDMRQFTRDLKGYHQMNSDLKNGILKDMNHAFDTLHKAEKKHS